MVQVKCDVTIRNKLGLHARPAMAFVDVASKFACDINVSKGKESVDGKSIMQMLLLAATQGTRLTIEANGADAREACKALEALVRDRFDEE
ncbi:MAG: HPr family phosphocarrier protein [Phycisphaerae bacterium]|nr:HPr family phosphocarrier protein [Phycisphaerae bacterium]